jgi:hypothetical protein
MSSYTVKAGECFSDVVLNSTGLLLNWDSILEANSISDWTPILTPGQVLIIPDGLQTDVNTIRGLSIYPAVNNSIANIYTKILNVVTSMLDNWILKTGYWNNEGIWKDDSLWIP